MRHFFWCIFAAGIQILSASSEIDFVSARKLQHPVKSIIDSNGNKIYFGYANGKYRELPQSVRFSDSSKTVVYTLGGNWPDLIMRSPVGVVYPVEYAIKDSEYFYYINIDGENVQLPFSDKLDELKSGEIRHGRIDLISANGLRYPIKRVLYPNGEIIYYGYYENAYRELPYSLEITYQNQTKNYVLSGTSPNIDLVGPNGVSYRLLYALENGQILYYVRIFNEYIQVPFGAELLSGKPAPPPIQFLNSTTVPYPIIHQNIQGKDLFFGYVGKRYRLLPAIFKIKIEGEIINLSLCGSNPYIGVQDTSGQVFPIEYGIKHGELYYYVVYDGTYIKVPVQTTVMLNPNIYKNRIDILTPIIIPALLELKTQPTILKTLKIPTSISQIYTPSIPALQATVSLPLSLPRSTISPPSLAPPTHPLPSPSVSSPTSPSSSPSSASHASTPFTPILRPPAPAIPAATPKPLKSQITNIPNIPTIPNIPNIPSIPLNFPSIPNSPVALTNHNKYPSVSRYVPVTHHRHHHRHFHARFPPPTSSLFPPVPFTPKPNPTTLLPPTPPPPTPHPPTPPPPTPPPPTPPPLTPSSSIPFCSTPSPSTPPSPTPPPPTPPPPTPPPPTPPSPTPPPPTPPPSTLLPPTPPPSTQPPPTPASSTPSSSIPFCSTISFPTPPSPTPSPPTPHLPTSPLTTPPPTSSLYVPPNSLLPYVPKLSQPIISSSKPAITIPTVNFSPVKPYARVNSAVPLPLSSYSLLTSTSSMCSSNPWYRKPRRPSWSNRKPKHPHLNRRNPSIRKRPTSKPKPKYQALPLYLKNILYGLFRFHRIPKYPSKQCQNELISNLNSLVVGFFVSETIPGYDSNIWYGPGINIGGGGQTPLNKCFTGAELSYIFEALNNVFPNGPFSKDIPVGYALPSSELRFEYLNRPLLDHYYPGSFVRTNLSPSF